MNELSERRELSLRAEGIGEDDLQRLAAFLRIGSDRLANRWRLAEGERFDALLVGPDDTLPMPLAGAADRALRLVDPPQFDGGPGQLCRPLAFEALVEQLHRLEASSASHPPPPPPPPPPSMPASPPSPALRPDDLYGVERMPARSAVGDDRRLQIVASLLTLRPVTLRELATQSGLEPADCVGVLHQLTALGLLRITDPRPTPARTGRRRSESARPQETPEPVGVMARLRGRLGLRGSR